MKQELEDKIVAAFDQVKEVSIPELGLVCYAKPFTIAELSRIDKKAEGDRLDTLVYTWIEKLLDANGEPVFSIKDKPLLRNKVPSDVIARVSQEINSAAGFESAEEAAGN